MNHRETVAWVARAASVAAAVLAAQWLSAASLTPLNGSAITVGGAGPWLSGPWLLAGAVAGAVALARANGLLWPWLGLALPLAVPGWPGAWLFAGPGAAMVWACVATVAAWGVMSSPATAPAAARWWRSAAVPMVVGLGWMGTASVLVAPHSLTGDAPHYLTIAQSLVDDGDVDVRNNYDERTHRSFFAGSLEPRHAVTSPWGPQYPFHGVGVSVLVAPGFSVLGALGATWTLVLLMTAGAGLLWIVVREITNQIGAAWFAWASLVASAPYTFHAAAIYPDGPASLGVVGALWLLARDHSRPPASLARLAAVGAGLATLPWLHARLALPAGIFGAACVLALLRPTRERWTRVSWLLTVPIISCAGWIAAAYVMFDTWNPAATILGRTAPGAMTTAPQGVFGLLFDREFGLLPTSPVYMFAPLGLVPLWRSRRLLTAAGSVTLAGVVLTSSLWVWWGGDSAPARFLTVVLPVAAVALGALWSKSGSGLRRVLLLAWACSATTTALMAIVDGGAHVYNFPDGRGSIFAALSPVVDAAQALPSMLTPAATLASEGPIALIWIAAVALAAAVVAWWPVGSTGGVGLAALVAILIGCVAASAAWAVRGVTATTPATAHLHLVSQLATAPTSGLAVWPPGPPEALARRLRLRTPESLTQPREVRLHVPNVPAGSYLIGTTPAGGSDTVPCRLELGRDAWPFADWNPAHAAPTLTLATMVHSVRVLGCVGSVGDVWLEPLVVAPTSGAIARRVARLGTLEVYALDDSSYLDGDGLWTGANRMANFLVASQTSASVQAGVAAGPAGVRVAISHGHQNSTLDLAPGTNGRVALGTVGTGRTIRVRIDVKGGFPGRLLSQGDSRSLGVRLTFETTPLNGDPR